MPYKKDYLTEEDKALLPALLEEARSRGMLPKLQQLMQRENGRKNKPFPKNSEGYYYKYNGLEFHPNQSQGDFIRSSAYFCGYIGGRGAGKTSSGAQKALGKLEAGEPGIIINPDFENLKISTWPEFREWIPWDRVVQRQRYRRHPEWTPAGPFTLVFDNGAWVIIKGLKDPESARGPNVNWLWYDEGGRDRDGMAWKIAVASVRISNTGIPTQRILTTTPNWQAPWMKELFYDKKLPADAIEAFGDLGEQAIVETFFGSLLDNKSNLDPATFATLLASYPAGYLREQEIMGKFVTPTGVLGSAAWFDNRILRQPPEGITSRIRYWDLAGSLKKVSGKKSYDPDENVGTLLSQFGMNFCVEEQSCTKQLPWEKFKELVASVCQKDGPYVPVWFEQEPAAGGVNQIEEFKLYIRDNVGPQWTVKGHKPEGDKVMRALPWFAEAARGQFYAIEGSWVSGFLEQLANFPEFAHDDRVDGVSGARAIIAPFKTWKQVEFISLGGPLPKPARKENDIIGL